MAWVKKKEKKSYVAILLGSIEHFENKIEQLRYGKFWTGNSIFYRDAFAFKKACFD